LIAVTFHDLQSGVEGYIHADESFHPASTFKVAVMMETFHQTAMGQFSLEDQIPVINSFTSIADGSLFSIFAEDDAEKSLYEKIGATETVREIIRLMIAQSSNLATNILMERLGASNVNAYIQELGITGVTVRRGVEDNRAFARGLNNAANARGLMQMMKTIAEGKVVSPEASREMIEVLLGQKFNEGIPALLPKTARVAHKTGWNEKFYHDFGIVFPERHEPYVVAMMTSGFNTEAEAHACVAEISERFYKRLL